MKEAKRVAETLAALDSRQKAESQTNKIAIRRKTLLRVTSLPSMTVQYYLNVGLANGHMATYNILQLRTQLTQALDHSALPDMELKAYLARIQKDVTKVLKEAL
jgi:DNA mismatch repair protein MSH4